MNPMKRLLIMPVPIACLIGILLVGLVGCASTEEKQTNGQATNAYEAVITDFSVEDASLIIRIDSFFAPSSIASINISDL